MPDAAADRRPPRTPKVLAGLAALACVACCALPTLIAAGVLGAGAGAGAGAVVGRLPALAVALAVLAAGAWWLGRRRRSCACGGKSAGGDECGCEPAGGTRNTH
ncbi:hypothetical protein [Streptomyces sp. NPDC006463]|uniref:hypothetical protein n=1 Tax=Streptomyces sp. NPDC006463 TaxID=3364746 RepID=UPI0036867328